MFLDFCDIRMTGSRVHAFSKGKFDLLVSVLCKNRTKFFIDLKQVLIKKQKITDKMR